MQVFLPYPDFQRSVACLDPKRLGNQVYRECLTLIRGGWPNHPVSKMWAPYKPALALYALCGLAELTSRGRHYPDHYATFSSYLVKTSRVKLPPWLGYEAFHASHRAALLYKDPDWYSRFGWIERPATPNERGSLPYVWPI